MDEQAHIVAFDIEAPIPIMFWEPLEFVMALTFMGFGIISNLWILGMLAGTTVLAGSRYLKRGSKRGAMQHYMWSLGLQLDQSLSKLFKPSWINEFIE
jgi:hypothetical protein